MQYFYYLAVGGIAAVVSYPLTNFVGLMARRWGFVDRPDGHHKGHGREVALGGGLAVFLAATVTFLVEYVSSDRYHLLPSLFVFRSHRP